MALGRPVPVAQVLIEDTAGGHAVPVDEYLPLLAEEEPITASEPPASILGDDELILGEEAGAGHGELACSFHLTKAILGAGVTALPHAFLLLGALPATAAFVGTALLTFYSCDCLVRGSVATRRATYSGVMTQALGRWAAVALDVSMLFNCFGMMSVYLIVVGDVLAMPEPPGSLPPVIQDLLSSRALVMGMVALVILAPLLSFRHLRHTTLVSGLGVAAIVVWAAATVVLAGWLGLQHRGHDISLWPRWSWFSGPPAKAVLRLTAVLPVVVCAFMCQMSFFSVVHELRPCTGRGMRRAAAAAVSVCLALFVVLALGSQVLFGSEVEHNVLRNFTAKRLAKAVGGSVHAAAAIAWAVRLAYLLSILASFPLQMKPFRDSLGWLVGGEAVMVAGGRWRPGGFLLTTYSTLAAVYLAAAALPSIWVPLQLVGATAGALIAFILPGLLSVKLSSNGLAAGWGGLGGRVLVAAGLVSGAAGIVSALWPD